MVILGLDSSTSTTGWAFSKDGKVLDAGYIDIKDIKNMNILGLDLSSTVCGYAISNIGKIIDAGFIDISKLSSYKEKAKCIIDILKHKSFEKIHIEESLASFTFGKSSQQTILKLAMNKAVICYILEEEFKVEILSINVNTMRKQLFGRCRIKGIKSKDFVKQELESLYPDVIKFTVLNKKGNWDERNSDMYDAIVASFFK
jgi:RNase H-fold protein (predicted Holliday junction resolvase)